MRHRFPSPVLLQRNTPSRGDTGLPPGRKQPQDHTERPRPWVRPPSASAHVQLWRLPPHVTHGIAPCRAQCPYPITHGRRDAHSGLRIQSGRSLFQFSSVFHIISGTILDSGSKLEIIREMEITWTEFKRYIKFYLKAIIYHQNSHLTSPPSDRPRHCHFRLAHMTNETQLGHVLQPTWSNSNSSKKATATYTAEMKSFKERGFQVHYL